MIKGKKKASPSRSFAWRPNFRDYDSLPDVRVVRTKIFIPAIFLSIAAVFTIFILFREYRALSVRDNIAKLQEEIDSYEKKHDEKVKLNGEFMAINRDLEEVIAFRKDKLIASDFLVNATARLTEGMYLTRVDYNETGVAIEGSVQVPAEEASRIVDSYMRSLEEADIVQGLMTEYKLTSLERDASSNIVNFKIEVRPPEKEKKKK